MDSLDPGCICAPSLTSPDVRVAVKGKGNHVGTAFSPGLGTQVVDESKVALLSFSLLSLGSPRVSPHDRVTVGQ